MKFYRNPKSTPEKRAVSDPTLKDFDIKVRPKRNVRNLPDAWNDIAAFRCRSWKRHRKAQYKAA